MMTMGAPQKGEALRARGRQRRRSSFSLLLGCLLGMMLAMMSLSFSISWKLLLTPPSATDEDSVNIMTTKEHHEQFTKINQALLLPVSSRKSDPDIPHQSQQQDFDPSLPAVIVTKIHDSQASSALQQSLCLLHYAYNHKVSYDIVVFTSLPWTEDEQKEVKDVIPSGNINIAFVVDNPGLHSMIQDRMTHEQQDVLLQRCNVTTVQELEWWTRCWEAPDGGSVTHERLSYNWQAEFRAVHLWNHPALQNYKIMMWMDSDAFCSKRWSQDPIATLHHNQLVLLFDHFPQGFSQGWTWPAKMQEAFGRPICSIDKTRDSTLIASNGDHCGNRAKRKQAPTYKQIHGFFHVTDLDFYRSPNVQKWLHIMLDNDTTFFSRMYDDQIAVTVPAAVWAGNRSWGMRGHGIELDVIHNFRLDGFDSRPVGGFQGWWNKHAETDFPEAFAGNCPIRESG